MDPLGCGDATKWKKMARSKDQVLNIVMNVFAPAEIPGSLWLSERLLEGKLTAHLKRGKPSSLKIALKRTQHVELCSFLPPSFSQLVYFHHAFKNSVYISKDTIRKTRISILLKCFSCL